MHELMWNFSLFFIAAELVNHSRSHLSGEQGQIMNGLQMGAREASFDYMEIWKADI